MTHMSREFSLVLLGAGLLTAGSFLWPEEDLAAHANNEAARQVAGANHARYHGGGMHWLIFHSGGRPGAGAATSRASITRGGFGGVGRSMSGVS